MARFLLSGNLDIFWFDYIISALKETMLDIRALEIVKLFTFKVLCRVALKSGTKGRTRHFWCFQLAAWTDGPVPGFPCKRPICINVEVWRVTILRHFATFCFSSIIVLSRVSLKTSSLHDILDRQDMMTHSQRQYEAMFQLSHLFGVQFASRSWRHTIHESTPCFFPRIQGRRGIEAKNASETWYTTLLVVCPKARGLEGHIPNHWAAELRFSRSLLMCSSCQLN